jgi:tetratricopeptide (TPR) repeat protein
MKIKTKSVMLKTRSHNPGIKTFPRPIGAVALHFLLCIFTLLLLPLRLSTSFAGTENSSEHITSQVDKPHPNQQAKSEPNRFAIAGNTITYTRGQLQQAILSVPEKEKDNRSKDELKRLIQQVRSIEFKIQKSPEPAIAVEPAPTTEPNKTSLNNNVEVQKGDKRKTAEAKLPYEPIADPTLQILKNLSQHPDKVNNPFQLAEILFLDGRLKEAAMFYQEALNRIGKNGSSQDEDRAWILFQIGNCLRNDDPPTAMKAYRQLITEHPSAPWTEIAKTLEKLIDWYQKDKPRESIAERKL